MNRLAALLAVMVFATAAAVAQAPARTTVVLSKGERRILTSTGSMITVTTPPDAPAGVVRTGFEQYGQNLAVEGLKPGEVKLLLEFTNSKIGQVVNVIVTDKKTFDRYRLASSALAGLEGLGPESVQVAGDRVVAQGLVYSAADLGRCLDLERSGGKTGDMPNIICAVRMNSAATAVYPQSEYRPQPSIELAEVPNRITGAATEGLEGGSRWRAILRLGDVPVAVLTSTNRADLVLRAGQFCTRFSRFAAEWKKRAAKSGVPFPVSFHVTSSGNQLQLGMVWRADQGSRGDTLLDVPRDDVDPGVAASVGGAERLFYWWSSVLEDAFGLYYAARRPSHTLAGDRSPLLAVYDNALRLAGRLDRDNAAVAVARGYYALKFSTGSDPFEGLLTRLPSGFTGQ